MNILALDLATKTGWAHSNGLSGMQNFAPRRGDSPGMRWIEFRAWLQRFLKDTPADMIVGSGLKTAYRKERSTMKRKPLCWLRDYWPLVLVYIAGLPVGCALGWWLFF